LKTRHQNGTHQHLKHEGPSNQKGGKRECAK